MKRAFTSFTLAAVLGLCLPVSAYAQTDGQTDGVQIGEAQTQDELYQAYLREKNSVNTTAAASGQERCITIMSEFPNSGALPRYQFFKLSEDLAVDTTPEFRAALSQFGEGDISDTTPILDVVETIANPVLRQAAPEIVVANMAHIIGFAQDCNVYVTGQLQSLQASDNSLAQDDILIAEDALYLRQILSDSLSRLGGENDLTHGAAIQAYSRSLIVSRDVIEFAGFDNDIDDLEALYLTDLDGRLARSNEIINSEINRETLGDAVQLSKDISNTANQQEKARSVNTLQRILGIGY
ncbi:MAG: hypothetical protein ABJG88_09555 [Litorimonas sp.]